MGEKRNMLSEIQKNQFNERAKAEAKKLLDELKIETLNDDNICDLQAELDFRVSDLVSGEEEGQDIDEELLKIYDLLTDIVLDNEEDLGFLNNLFFN